MRVSLCRYGNYFGVHKLLTLSYLLLATK